MSSAQITVESSGGTVYRVTVNQDKNETKHEVTVMPDDIARYTPGTTPERLLEASFEFLLEREPASWSAQRGSRRRVRRRSSASGRAPRR